MVSSTETTASTSAAGMAPLSHPRHPECPCLSPWIPSRLQPRLHRPRSQLRMPTAPGLRQMRPRAPQPQAPTLEGQEEMPATPYHQQVFPPQCLAPPPSTTPSISQDNQELAGEEGGARGRSLSQGPQDRQRRSRSSTRGSQKHRRGNPSDSLTDRMANYVASGWKQDLTHFIGCCWEAQIGSLDQDKWHVAITKFLEGHKRIDATPVYALRGETVQRGHRPRPPGPQQLHWVDWPRGLLPLESSPARPAPPCPPPPRAANA